MATPFKPTLGKQRFPYTDRTTEEGFTSSVRAQMQHIIKEFKRWNLHMDNEGAQILKDALAPTFQKTQIEVPKDTLALKNSGYLIVKKFRGKTQVEMGYGKGGHPNYAAIVHEKLEYAHKSPTKAKYLEGPILADFGAIQSRIARGYKEASGV